MNKINNGALKYPEVIPRSLARISDNEMDDGGGGRDPKHLSTQDVPLVFYLVLWWQR